MKKVKGLLGNWLKSHGGAHIPRILKSNELFVNQMLSGRAIVS